MPQTTECFIMDVVGCRHISRKRPKRPHPSRRQDRSCRESMSSLCQETCNDYLCCFALYTTQTKIVSDTSRLLGVMTIHHQPDRDEFPRFSELADYHLPEHRTRFSLPTNVPQYSRVTGGESNKIHPSDRSELLPQGFSRGELFLSLLLPLQPVLEVGVGLRT